MTRRLTDAVARGAEAFTLLRAQIDALGETIREMIRRGDWPPDPESVSEIRDADSEGDDQ